MAFNTKKAIPVNRLHIQLTQKIKGEKKKETLTEKINRSQDERHT